MITIDEKKCIGCLKCIKVCPFTVIIESNGRPKIQERKLCLDCYHCGAVCPTDALNKEGEMLTRSKNFYEFPEKYRVNLKELVMSRRSYRHFDDRKIPQDLIDETLTMIKWVPSTKNEHPVEWKILDDENKIAAVMEMILQFIVENRESREVASEYKGGNNVVLGEATTILIAYTDKPCLNPIVDATIAMTTAELIFQSQGIGTCWSGYLKRFIDKIPKLKKVIGLPESASVQCALMLGYPKDEDYISIPNR